MIDKISAAILGFVQGLTEFLPVSSSGHLVVFAEFLSAEKPPIAFDLMLHLGTLVPILWVYRADILAVLRGMFTDPKGEQARLAWLIVLGSIPTAILGIGFEDVFERLFHTPRVVGITFFITGTFLFATKYIKDGGRGVAEITIKDALIIGLIQGLAITPGISRSGSTIAIALFLGLKRDVAAKYSFLLSIPAIVGAFIFKFDELVIDQDSIGSLGIGFVVSALSGLVALKILLKLVNSGDFSKFSYYLWTIAVLAIFFL